MGIRLILFGILFLQLYQPAVSQLTSWRKKFSSTAVSIGINPANPFTVFTEGATGDLYVSYDGGNTWAYRSSPGVSHIRQIVVHPTDTLTMFCVPFPFASGPYVLRKSTDYGLSWRTVLANININDETMVYDPDRPDTMYIGNSQDSKVYRSTDRGETWTIRGSPPGFVGLTTLVVRPDSTSILYLGAAGPAIYKSMDAGATWKTVYKVSPIRGHVSAEVISQTNPLIAYATIEATPDTSYGVLKTVDGGEHWQRTSLTSVSLAGVAICEPNFDIVYAGASDNRLTTVYKTTNGGSTWSSLDEGLRTGDHVWCLKVHPLEPGKVWATLTYGDYAPDGVYRLGSLISEVHGVAFDAVMNDTVKTGIITIAGTYDSVNLKSSRGTFSFHLFDVDLSPPTAHIAAYPFYITDTLLSVDSTVFQNIFLQRLPLTSLVGIVSDSSLRHPVKATVDVTATTLYGNVDLVEETDSSGYFKFTDIAQPYEPLILNYSLFVDPEIPFTQLLVSSIHVDTAGSYLLLFTQPADVFVVGEDSANYQSYYKTALDSLGLHTAIWNSITKGPAPFQRGIEFNKKTVIYFSGTKHTSLRGQELNDLTACLNAGCNLLLTGQDIVEKNDSSDLLMNEIGVRFNGNTSVIACVGQSGDLFDGSFFFTTGSGANDQTSRDILSIINPRVKPIFTYGVAGIAGVRLDSTGAGGKVIMTGFGFEAIDGVAKRIAVMHRVIDYFDGTVGVEQAHDVAIPKDFRLEQNHPNPFNPSTAIRYHLPIRSHVSFTIYNLLGQQMETLVNAEQPPGQYQVLWTPSLLPSGVYLYRLQAGSFTETKKLILLR